MNIFKSGEPIDLSEHMLVIMGSKGVIPAVSRDFLEPTMQPRFGRIERVELIAATATAGCDRVKRIAASSTAAAAIGTARHIHSRWSAGRTLTRPHRQTQSYRYFAEH